MNGVLHKVRLSSQERYGKRVPPAAVGEILRVLPVAVQRSIRMGFVGRSTITGRQPAWLKAVSDIRLVGFDGKEDTFLYFEAPRFGDAAGELYRQQELWSSRPSSEDTGFDLLGDVLADVTAGAEDSDRFDSALLRHLVQFQGGLADGFDGIFLSGHRYPDTAPAAVTAATVASARRLHDETPLPQRVRVVGRLDMIWQSRQGFLLALDDGQEVHGLLADGDVSSLTALFNQRVVVHGRAVYRPSGRLLRLDAELLEPGPGEPGLWSRVPPPRARKLDLQPLMQMQTPKSGVTAIFGKWPGEETDEEILAMLKRMG